MKNIIFAEKTFADYSLLPRQRTPRPKFCRENFRKLPQNREIRKSFLPRKFSAIRYVFGIHHQNKCTLALETLASWSKLNIFTLSLFLPSSSPASPFSSFSSSSYLRLFLLPLLPPLSPPPSPSSPSSPLLLLPPPPPAPKTHPNVDKQLFNQRSMLGLKQEGKSFPLNQDVGVLKWRLQTTDESMMPLSSKPHHVLNTQYLDYSLL